MAKLTMPRINITFMSKAASFIARSEKGVVLLILRDDVLGGRTYAITDTTEIPDGLSVLNQTMIRLALLGHVTPPKKVLVYAVGEDESLTDALKWAATQNFDYICGAADCTVSEAETIALWVKSDRANNFAIYRAVLPDCAADSAAEYCARIAGLLAGATMMRISSPYESLPEVTDVYRLILAERDEAVGAGKYILWADGRAYNGFCPANGNLKLMLFQEVWNGKTHYAKDQHHICVQGRELYCPQREGRCAADPPRRCARRQNLCNH